MARKPRLEWEGSKYHIMGRGNARARIFHEEGDYLLFLNTLRESLERFGVELHAGVLMSNHYHLAASTPRPISAAGWHGYKQPSPPATIAAIDGLDTFSKAVPSRIRP